MAVKPCVERDSRIRCQSRACQDWSPVSYLLQEHPFYPGAAVLSGGTDVIVRVTGGRLLDGDGYDMVRVT